MKKLTLTLALVLMAFFASAQIYELENSTFSVSRNSGNGNVVYTQKNDSIGNFVFADILDNNTVFEKRRTIKKFHITDFTYSGDTIYVTGDYNGGKGFYGWAKTTGSNPTRWKFHMHLIQNYIAAHRPGHYDTIVTAYFKNLKRIKVFHDAGVRHILLVGDCYNFGTTHPGCLLDVHSETDSINYAYSLAENIDDVEVLDDYVVTVSRKGFNDTLVEGLYHRVLNKSGFSLSDNLFDNYAYSHDLNVIGPTRLKKIDNNNYVLLYKSDLAGIYSIVPFSVNNGILQVANRYDISAGTAPAVKDMAYSASSHKLAVLHNNDSTGIVAEFNCANFPTIALSRAYSPLNNNTNTLSPMELQSVDYRPNSGFCISGNQGGYLTIWRTEVCDITQSLTMESTSINITILEGATTRAKIKQRNVACENLMPGNIPTSDICDEQPFIPFPDNSDDKEEAE